MIESRPLTIADLISVKPDVMSGMEVFRGTRVPIESVFENLAAGMSLDEILEDFPTLDRNDVIALIELSVGALKQARAA
jgi:uncharacterized protein (DUF433 family)